MLAIPEPSKHGRLQAFSQTMDKLQPDNPVDQLHHIKRLDCEADRILHAWRVLVARDNIAKAKNFADAKYGGKDEALQAAICYRDEFLAKTDHFEHQMWLRTYVRRTNTSGMPGVYRAEEKYCRSPDKQYVYWVAQWTDELCVQRKRRFSVSRYGEQEARRLAIAERELQLERACSAKESHWRDPLCTRKKKPKLQTPDVQ